MFLLGFLICTFIVGIPAILCLWRARAIWHITQNPVGDLYRSKLRKLEKEHTTHLIDDTEYEMLRYTMQRKLSDTTPPPPQTELTTGHIQTTIAVCTVLLIPVAALFLYTINGLPFLPSQSADEKTPLSVPEQSTQIQLDRLNTKLASMSPKDTSYATLHIRRGQLEEQMGLASQTVDDWNIALKTSFTPELALQIAELETRNAGHVTKEALVLYHRALDASPPDAPWRLSVEARIASREHDNNHDKDIPSP